MAGGRQTALYKGDFCIFMLGIRLNSFRKIGRWWRAGRSMPKMLKELEQNPELGLLGGEVWWGRTLIFVQYWRSFRHLEDYAKSRNHEHLPAWKGFNQLVGTSGDVGIWHETYQIRAGDYENVYVNMPPMLFGKVGKLVDASGALVSARGRMAASVQS